MASAGPYVYDKAVLACFNKDWFHGELTTVQAEHALTVSQRDCFLVRVDQGALVLSLSHHGQYHHVKIKYSRGGYELESGSTEYSFFELEELVTHYSERAIGGLKITLGEVCHKTGHETTPPHYDVITDHIYFKGEPTDLLPFTWYHGKLSTQRACELLRHGKSNVFFVRHDSTRLILTKRTFDKISHTPIHHSPEGYKLERDSKLFDSVPKMIEHYGSSLGTPLSSHCQQEIPATVSSLPLMPTRSVSLPPKKRNLQPSLRLLSTPAPFEVEFGNGDYNMDPTIFGKAEERFHISWRKSPPLPIIVASPSIVKLGDNIYVGGGLTDIESRNSNSMFKYNIRQNVWTYLVPHLRARCYCLVVWKNELTAIGGVHLYNMSAANAVSTYRDNMWQELLPPMPTPRFSLSAVVHEDRLIVAAGGATQLESDGSKLVTDAVEIYTSAWYKTKPLPFPIFQFKMCIVGTTCYTLGGTTKTDEQATTVPCATISSLLENAVSVKSRLQLRSWDQLPGKLPLIYSSPVELDGKLIAVGGSAEIQFRRGTRFVSIYDFATNTWVECKCAALPTPLYRPGVLKLDDSRVMIVGGQPKMQYMTSNVHIGIITRTRNN